MIHYELKYVYQQRINVRKYVRHFDHVPTRVRVRMKFHLLSIHRQRNAASRTVIGHSYQSLLSMQICEIYNNFIDRSMKTRIGLYYSLDNIIREFFFFFLWNLTKRVFYKNYTIFLQFVVLNNNEDIYITKILQDFVYYTLKSFAILLIYRWTRTNPLTKTVVKFFPPIFFPIIRNGRRVQLGQSEKYDPPLPPLIRLKIQNDVETSTSIRTILLSKKKNYSLLI